MKKLLLLIILVSIRTSLFAQIPMTGLVAYYPFNGNANDSSGNGFNGVLGGQTLNTGICSRGYRFINNYIDCGDPAGNQFDLVNDASISLWVKPYNFFALNTTLVAKDVGAGNNNPKWVVVMDSNKLAFHINGPGWGTGYWCYSDTFSFALNTFYHIVVTKSGNHYGYFINAAQHGSDSLPYNLLDVPASLTIGKTDVSAIDATLDDILIYNRVLTQPEITQIYNSQIYNIISSNVSASICQGDTYTFPDATTSTTATVHTSHFSSPYHCDSSIVTTLTVNTPNTGVSLLMPTCACPSELVVDSVATSYQWINCNTGNSIISGQTDSIYYVLQDGNYAVIINQNGCIDTSACYYVLATDVLNLNHTPDIDIYPNPFTEQTTIIFSEIQKNTVIKVVNLVGEEILQTIINGKQYTLEMGGMSKGIYFVQIIDEKKSVINKKIVIQ